MSNGPETPGGPQIKKKSRQSKDKAQDSLEPKSSKKRKRERDRLEGGAHSYTPESTGRSKAKKTRLESTGEEESLQFSVNGAPSSPRISPEQNSLGAHEPKQSKKDRKEKRRKTINGDGDSSQLPIIPAPSPDIPPDPPADLTATNQANEYQQEKRGNDERLSDQQVNKSKGEEKEEESSDTIEGSPFFTQTTSFYLPLSPISQTSPLHGLCAEHLSPLILTYCRPLNGVILSYSNPRFSRENPAQQSEDDAVLSRAIDEYGVTYVWVTADFMVLRPQRDSWIKGYVSVQSDSHIGLVCWNLFNASIGRKDLPKDWRWMRGESDKEHMAGEDDGMGGKKAYKGGYWLDGNGEAVDGVLLFRIQDFESLPAFGKDRSFMSIDGSLRSKEEEEQARINGQQAERAGQERQRKLHEAKAAKRRRESEAGKSQVNGGSQSSTIANESAEGE